MQLLTRSDFENAVKDALRHHAQPDLLAGNALLRASLLTGSGGAGAAAQSLRDLLVETARLLFTEEHDQRLYRILELTYFRPVPKQEVAANRLGLSFSTYRRHLTASVDQMVERLWQQEQQAREAPAPVARTAAPAATPAPADAPSVRPPLSIAVLPFLNLSGDAEEDYFVDGIVDSLIIDLSIWLAGSFVISRSTAFTYKGRAVPVQQVGKELGVRYVLEGSVLLSPERLRINVQLIDATTDEHLWAERFDKERREILQVQDEIVARLTRSVGIHLILDEDRRRSLDALSWDAVDLVMRARALVSGGGASEEQTAEAIDLLRRALARDPNCVNAMVHIALARTYQVVNLLRLEDRETLLGEAEDMVTCAAAQAPNHPIVLKARGLLLRLRGRFTEAITASEILMARNPAEPTAYKEIGLNKLYLGATSEATEWFRRADAIAPRDPECWTWLQGLGRALMQLGHDADAVEVLRRALDNNADYPRGKALLAAAEALAGDLPGARLHLAEYTAHEPDMTVRRFAAQPWWLPPEAVSATYRRESERLLAGLRRAGMPE